MRSLQGKPRNEFVGKMLFDPKPSPGYSRGRFLGIVTEAVEGTVPGKVYCQYTFNDGEYDYCYIEDELPTEDPLIWV